MDALEHRPERENNKGVSEIGRIEWTRRGGRKDCTEQARSSMQPHQVKTE